MGLKQNQKSSTLKILGPTLKIGIGSVLLGGCATAPSTFDPQGPAAAEIAQLGWILLALGGAVFAGVMGLLTYALFRARGRTTDTPPNPKRDQIFILGGGVATTVILAVVYGLTLQTLAALAAPDNSDEFVIEVVGRQWWWEVRYPGHEVITANEIHIPVDQPVTLRVTSADVIHSFWVPQLHGKIDLIPAQSNVIWLQADTPGVYFGECAEFCGIQHAKMTFVTVAESEADFLKWLEQQRQPATAPTDPQAETGLQIFFKAKCDECHTIRGTEAAGTLGPDLTHLASRRTLAAGTLPNTRGHLGGWIINPQSIKPGALMPSTPLTGVELQAILFYLESLE